MRATRMATLLTTLGAILMLVNHKLVYAVVDRIAPGVGGADHGGVELSPSMMFMVKLDHFFQNRFYVLIPLTWLVSFLAWVVLRRFSGLWKPARKPEVGPVDLESERPLSGVPISGPAARARRRRS